MEKRNTVWVIRAGREGEDITFSCQEAVLAFVNLDSAI